jgi:hypothetical protein
MHAPPSSVPSSVRAALPISFSLAPPLPITIARCVGRPTRICWWISTDPSGRSSYFSVSTALA